MGVITVRSGADYMAPYVKELIVEEESDLEDVGTGDKSPGSCCLVIETGDVYILNNEKEWKKVGG